MSSTQGNSSYNSRLLVVAGLGGLLYGVDVGIIAGALPYLEATSGLNEGQLSIVVAAVLLGSVMSTLFAGLAADWIGRKPLMTLSGTLFVLSIPIIALSRGYESLVLGRLLQGVSAGFIGVVVPLYLAECLTASSRGKGTGIFQWLLTLGIVAAAIVGIIFSIRVEEVSKTGDVALLFAFKDSAWRNIFWVSLPPGILFVIGSLLVTESPRWLFTRGRRDAAYAALLRSRTQEYASLELAEMDRALPVNMISRSLAKESLLQRKYVIPFLLACVILACNQATGINSIIGYNTNILLQGGLSDVQAHWGYVVFTIVNFMTTVVGVMLVDRKGRKFLLTLGSSGIIVTLVCVAVLFRRTEKQRVDTNAAVQAMVSAHQDLNLHYDDKEAQRLMTLSGQPGQMIANRPTSVIVFYSFGDFRAATPVVRSDDKSEKPIVITRDSCVPANRIVAFFSNPFGDLDTSRRAPLRIEHVLITPVPSKRNGEFVALGLFAFMAFFAIGPGVCVWLALSELMPTRIRSNGMSIALLINQAVSTSIAASFLPIVGRYGYSTILLFFAVCTVVYLITAVFFLPETKGKTLGEIEVLFEKPNALTPSA